MAVSQLSALPGRRAAGLHAHHVCRHFPVRYVLRAAPSSCFFLFLVVFQENPPFFPAAFQKNFKIDKKIVCICEKMGYNKMV